MPEARSESVPTRLLRATLPGVLLVGCAHVSSTPHRPAIAPSVGECTQIDGLAPQYGAADLLDDYLLASVRARPNERVPLDVSGLPAYLGARYGEAPVVSEEGERQIGEAREYFRIQRAVGETVLVTLRTVAGDCPTTTREALGYDANGRFAWRRWTHENCEFVDARIVEDRLSLDSTDRFLALRRTVYDHPVHAESDESRPLGPTLTFEDGSMPPEHERETCRFDHRASPDGELALHVECTHDPGEETSLRMHCDAVAPAR